jgi:hypothetical protein
MSSAFKLTEPIQAHGETVFQLKIQKPKAVHLLAMDDIEGENARYIHLISELAGIPRSSAEALDAGDFMELKKVIDRFLFHGRKDSASTTSPETSPTPSAGPQTP